MPPWPAMPLGDDHLVIARSGGAQHLPAVAADQPIKGAAAKDVAILVDIEAELLHHPGRDERERIIELFGAQHPELGVDHIQRLQLGTRPNRHDFLDSLVHQDSPVL
eukprot:4866386-Prymnesium_polylepis.1